MSLKILVADDEPNIVISLEYLLKREGYTVLIARDGQEAIDAHETLQATKILMLTAKGRDTDVTKGLGLGADAYMTKPFSTRELVQKVAHMLGRDA
jgi:DNA-binding response OmpR family regulator